MVSCIRFRRQSAIVLSIMILTCVGSMIAGDFHNSRKSKAVDPQAVNFYTPFIINNFATYYSNNGDAAYNPYAGIGGLEYPAGSQKIVIFEDGIVWGCNQNGVKKVGGSTYRHGLSGGRISIPGTVSTLPVAENPASASVRVYKVRPDISPSGLFETVTTDMNREATLASRYSYIAATDLYNQYVQDWLNWPAAQGAPFDDKDGNGVYDPMIDVPGVPGAGLTAWFVANDVNASNTLNFHGSQPIGLEFQRTIWAYRSVGRIGNVILSRNVVINKSGIPLDSTYITQWSDPDLGYANDDFAGCDTTRSLGYVYNALANDAVYGVQVPAVGYQFILGPSVPGTPSDSAMSNPLNPVFRKGFRNLPMTSFNMFVNGVTGYNDPPLGNISGTYQWFNLMKGLIGATGAPYIDPITGKPDNFVFSGDPVEGTGWLDGSLAPPNDRRIALSSGPFTMAAGDTQQITTAFGLGQGSDRLGSVTALKQLSDFCFALVKARGAEVALLAVDTLVPYQSKMTFSGTVTQLSPQPYSTTWFLAKKPAGSMAAFSSVTLGSAQLQTDLIGTYKVGFARSPAVSGSFDTAYATFRVSANRAPIPAVNLSSTITLGDTLTLDGTPTTDPDGNPLTYRWTITGASSGSYETLKGDTVDGSFGNKTAVTSFFVPARACNMTVLLDVNDGEFTRTVAKSVVVNPRKTSNMSTGKVFGYGYLSEGFFGAFRVRKFASQYWAHLVTGYATLDFGSTNPPMNFNGLMGGAFHVVDQGLIFSANGRSGIGIGITNGVDAFNSITSYDPDGVTNEAADSMATEVYAKNSRLYFSYGSLGLRICDITNPASPLPVQSITNEHQWTNFVVEGVKLFALHPDRFLSVTDITNPNGALSVGTYSFSWTPTMFSVSGSKMVIANGDTLELYDVSNTVAIAPHAKWLPSREVRSDNRVTSIALSGNYLAVGTYEGTYVYNVSNIDAPAVIAKWLTGVFQGRVFYDGNRLLVSTFDRYGGDSPVRPYPIIELRIPDVTGVNVNQVDGSAPSSYELSQNYPNPFNPNTTIGFAISKSGFVTLTVYNTLGQEVATVVRGEMAAGCYNASFDASSLSSGMYMYRLNSGDYTSVRKMMLLK
jgi:hypothetical protein